MERLEELEYRKKEPFPVRLQRAIKVCEKMKKPMLENRKLILDRYAAGFYQGRETQQRRPINMIWRYFLVIVRDLFLKGSGIASFRLETTGLLILGPIAITLAAIRFTKRAR